MRSLCPTRNLQLRDREAYLRDGGTSLRICTRFGGTRESDAGGWYRHSPDDTSRWLITLPQHAPAKRLTAQYFGTRGLSPASCKAKGYSAPFNRVEEHAVEPYAPFQGATHSKSAATEPILAGKLENVASGRLTLLERQAAGGKRFAVVF